MLPTWRMQKLNREEKLSASLWSCASLPCSRGNHLQKYLHSQETPHSTVLPAYHSSSLLPDSLNFQKIYA